MIQKNSHKSDEQLYAMLFGSKAEKEVGFTELYQRHSQRIYQYCRRICGNDQMASDILQETFLRFLNVTEYKSEMSNISGFLLRIARNLCIDSRKKQSHTVSFERMDIPSHDMSLESKELRHLLVAALDALPDDHKEAIILQAYNGLSYQEISDATNVPISTVRNWIVRGKKKLREILAPYIQELEQ
ncbi:MAG: RNA polymerase sigma factor [Ignavibacteriae bacterium]|nr:RNA polymerase sigma factor [Ignavibacteriota bacterium]